MLVTAGPTQESLDPVRYLTIAAGLTVEVEELIFPERLQSHSFDLGVIVGNALDNAIEAC